MMARGGGSDSDAFAGPVRIRMTNVREAEPGGGKSSMTAYYAAGIGVMFLLFAMAGAAGTLLEEEETGTLERLLASRVSMGTLLVSRWLFFGIVGLCQVVVMFVWGAVAFGLDLFTANHLAGFTVMAVLTAAAAAAFGIGLATLCRTRAQLGAISTIVILIMSALGGSMVPRFVMPAFMDTTALFTFNGWALDGFLKVFWYDDPAAGVGATLVSILPQAIALAVMTFLFLGLARLFARRWEAA
jgi:ABC-2 type transport system permease protein